MGFWGALMGEEANWLGTLVVFYSFLEEDKRLGFWQARLGRK